MIIDPGVPNLLYAIAACIASVTGIISVLQNAWLSRKAAQNQTISRSNNTAINAVANQVTVMDVKVDAVQDNTNGHMTSLIAAVAPADPALATAAAIKIVENAEKVAAKIKGAD